MKRIAAIFLYGAIMAGIFSGCAGTEGQEETVPETTSTLAQTEATEQTVPVETEPLTALDNDFRIALIARDSFDQTGMDLEAGALKAAEELGCEVINMSPVMRHDGQQAGQIEQAVAEGFEAIVVAAMDSETVSAALKAAMDAGVKVICVDTAADMEADAQVCTDDKAAGKTAAEALITALEENGVAEGPVGIVAVNKDTGFSTQREAGFREAFAGKAYTLLETQYSEGDAAKAHAIAESYIDQGAVGIFACSEGCMTGAANAVQEAGGETAVVGFGEAQVEEGHVSSVLVKDYSSMGYAGVNTACALLHEREPGDDITDIGILVLSQ